jgi:hypothetical protein
MRRGIRMSAASKARRTAKSLAVVIDVSSFASSARRIVVTLKDVWRARSSALHRTRARAALIWALVRSFDAILTYYIYMLCFIPYGMFKKAPNPSKRHF